MGWLINLDNECNCDFLALTDLTLALWPHRLSYTVNCHVHVGKYIALVTAQFLLCHTLSIVIQLMYWHINTYMYFDNDKLTY